MAIIKFTGFAGVELVADAYGSSDHPCVLLLPGATQSRRVWADAARNLARAGRYAISLDLRGHGESARPADGNYGLDAFVADLVAVLAQLSSRPVIVGSTLGGWIALTALGESQGTLATGLVLTNPPPEINSLNAQKADALVSDRAPIEDYDKSLYAGGFDFTDLEKRLQPAAKNLKIPTLIVRGADSELSSQQSTQGLAEHIPTVEVEEIEGAGHYVAFDKADEFNARLLEFLEKYIPHQAPEYVSGSDSRTLRDAMACFATGITVVTTRDGDGTPVGLTANSFTSVSLDPALVLVCLGKNVGSLDAFNSAHSFAINVLHTGQQPVSNLFAAKGKDRFAEVQWDTWELDVPILENTLASFECKKVDALDQGDHIIFVGEVMRARFESHRDPLLYFGGKYRRLHFG